MVDFEFLKSVIGPKIKLEDIELGLKGISGNTVKSLGITRKIEASIENQRTYTKFISLIKAAIVIPGNLWTTMNCQTFL